MTHDASPARPRIVVTIADAATAANPPTAARKNELYLEAIRGHGGEPVALDATASDDQRASAFATMDGLLLTGGADIDPGRYRATSSGARDTQPDRDALEAEAWREAESRGLPVLGICRGLQAVNVFSGGTLLQDVAGHEGPSYGTGPAQTHPMRLLPGTRLARILSPSNVGGGSLIVNTYHHQAVRRSDLAPGLVASAVASSAVGELVEGLETRSGRFLMAVQCHPERTESTPPAFDRLWRVFVDACRGSVVAREEGAIEAATRR